MNTLRLDAYFLVHAVLLLFRLTNSSVLYELVDGMELCTVEVFPSLQELEHKRHFGSILRYSDTDDKDTTVVERLIHKDDIKALKEGQKIILRGIGMIKVVSIKIKGKTWYLSDYKIYTDTLVRGVNCLEGEDEGNTTQEGVATIESMKAQDLHKIKYTRSFEASDYSEFAYIKALNQRLASTSRADWRPLYEIEKGQNIKLIRRDGQVSDCIYHVLGKKNNYLPSSPWLLERHEESYTACQLIGDYIKYSFILWVFLMVVGRCILPALRNALEFS